MNKKYALITGASSGIGEALMHEFAGNGHNIIAVSKDESLLQQTVTKHQAMHPSIEIISIAKDLTHEQAPQELYNEIKNKNYEVEVLINDAGLAKLGEFVTIPIEQDIELIRLNIEALTRLTKLFLPDMLVRKSGKILNLGSITGFQPGPRLAVYHATKAYVVSLSEALAEELKDSGVTVTCLCPGPVETDFFNKADMQKTRVVRNKHITMMTAESVAKAGHEALMKGDRVVVPGAMNKILTFTRRVIPGTLQAKLQKQFYEESEEKA